MIPDSSIPSSPAVGLVPAESARREGVAAAAPDGGGLARTEAAERGAEGAQVGQEKSGKLKI